MGELRQAVKSQIGQHDIDPDALPQVDTMQSLCAGVITVDQEEWSCPSGPLYDPRVPYKSQS